MASAALAPASAAHAQSAARPASPADPASPASPPGKEQAKKLFEEGVQLEKKADHAGALAKYKAAEAITSTPGLRFHKGYCLEMMGKLAAALEEYELADAMAREQGKPDVHAAIAPRLEPLRARVPQIAIRLATPAPDAEVQLDSVTVPSPQLDGTARRIDPGEHAVTARAAGYRTFTRKVQVPEAMTTTVDIVLDRTPDVAALPGAAGAPGAAGDAQEARQGAPQAESSNGGLRRRSLVPPLVTTAGALALAAGGVALVLVAGSEKRAGDTECPRKLSCDDEQSSIRTLDALALGSFIGAAGLGVLSVVLWTSRSTERAATAEKAPAARAHVTVAPSMVGLEGTF